MKMLRVLGGGPAVFHVVQGCVCAAVVESYHDILKIRVSSLLFSDVAQRGDLTTEAPFSVNF